MIRLRTFGGLALEEPARGLGGAAGQRRPMALLLLLATAAERGVSRDKLLGLLWPDSDVEHARSALRQTLYALRRDLGAPELFQGTADLRLNAALMTSDLAEFDAAVAAGDRERIIELYQGPLAEGFFLGKAPEFERWLEGERRLRAQQFAAAAVALASEASRAGDHARAVVYWRRAATEDRLSARVAVELMRALAEAGDRAGAIQHARVYENVIRAELDAAPDPSVAALAEELRRAAPAARSNGARPPAPPSDVGAAGPEVGPAAEAAEPANPDHPPRAKWLFGLLALGATLLGVAAVTVVNRRPVGPLDPTLVAVAPYEVFDPALALWREGLMDVLSHNLDGAGPLRTLAPAIAIRHWSGRAHPASARDLARRTGAGIVVFGYMFRVGADSVRAVASLYDARRSRNLTVESRDAMGRMDRLTDSLTVALLREIEAWLPVGSGGQTSIGRTSSMEALKDFLRGEQFFRRNQWDSARVAYERAVSHDSTFTLALRRLGNVIGWEQGESNDAAVAYRLRAGALNRGLGRRDSLLVLTDSLRAAAAGTPTYLEEWPFTRRLFAILEHAVERYPEDPEFWYSLGEARYHYGFGPRLSVTPRRILDAFDRAIALDSAFAPAYVHAPGLALSLGDRELAVRYLDAQLRRQRAGAPRTLALLLRELLAPGAAYSPAVRRHVDSASLNVLFLARTSTSRWPDSAETALRLSRELAGPRRLPADAPVAAKRYRIPLLAAQLAFRGHMREAHHVLAEYDGAAPFQLILSGPASDSADARVRRLVAEGSDYAMRALYWWAGRRDTAAIRAFLAAERVRARSAATWARRQLAAYDTAAALAYMALLRADTSEAVRRFTTLPDTLCLECYADRLTRARLLAAVGRHREALVHLEERLVGFESPFDVLFAFERARLAERLGQRAAARVAYQFVVDAWRLGDAEVQTYVREARRGLGRTADARERRGGRE